MRTALINVDPPDPFIELDAAKQHLRVDSADEDELIKALITAVCGVLDGPDGTLDRAIGQQTLKLLLPGFDSYNRNRGRADYLHSRNLHRMELPLPPARGVTSITYFDVANVQQTLTADKYILIDCGTAASFLIPAGGTYWPSTYCRLDAVSITFTAGFDEEGAEDEDDTGKPLPGPIMAAAKLMLGDLYLNREAYTASPGLTVVVENPAVKALLSPWRILKM